MTVAELMAILAKHDPKAEVIIPDAVFGASEFGHKYPTRTFVDIVGQYKDPNDGEGLDWWMSEEPNIFKPNSIMIGMR